MSGGVRYMPADPIPLIGLVFGAKTPAKIFRALAASVILPLLAKRGTVYSYLVPHRTTPLGIFFTLLYIA